MTVQRTAELLIYLGAIGMLHFSCLAFSARQLHAQGVTTARLQQRMTSPAVRHASAIIGLSAATLLVGIALRLYT